MRSFGKWLPPLPLGETLLIVGFGGRAAPIRAR